MTAGVSVLHVTAWHPTSANPGWGVFVREHVRASSLTRSARTVHLHGLHQPMVRPTIKEIPDGVRVAYWSRPPLLGDVQGVAAAVVGARRCLGGRRPTIIHAHVAQALAPSLALGAIWRVPVVFSEHSTQFLEADPADFSWYQRRVLRLLLRRVAGCSAVGPHLSAAMQEIGNLPVSPRVIPNVVSAQFCSVVRGPVHDPAHLVWVGALVDQKDPMLFVEVLRLLGGRSAITATIVGEGPLGAAVDAAVATLPDAVTVHHHKYLSKADLAALFGRATMLVLTSRFETFSVVTAEALATGLPAVVTACGGPEGFVSDEDGVVLRTRDPKDTADAITTALARSWDPAAIAARARSTFGVAAVARALDSFYSDAVRGHLA